MNAPVKGGTTPAAAATTPAALRKVFVKTHGCQMNVYDSERMGDALAREGFVATDTPDDADLILMNTCHIREKAAEKVYSWLGRMRQIKESRESEGRQTVIAVAGCVAQAEGDEIIKRSPAVDLVVGPQSYHRLGEFVATATLGKKVVATDFAIEDKFGVLPPATSAQIRGRGVAAFLTIQEGCDKFCTFCVVPYTRGAEVSRSSRQILDEARRLADSGVREVTLLGQNVNAWHGSDGNGLAMRLGDLLAQLSEIPGIERLRYTTSHPIDMEESLIEAHRLLPKLMPYLHLPVQAGSNRILKAMNRRHDREFYYDLVERIRDANPDIALSGDFITGFPGETEADFEDTLSLIQRVKYASAFSFRYSPRPGTPGADLPGQVDEEVRAERLARLQKLIAEQQFEFNKTRHGMEMRVLVEKPAKREGQVMARSPWLQPVILPVTAGKIGDIINVRIVSAGPNSLAGEPL
ncbi:MAG: tRNA (N6-isopentenyl adenosine(37)-C2)-methylthiotransferase MiaB [Nitratireductor sp.]